MTFQGTESIISADGLHGHVVRTLPGRAGKPPQLLVRFDNGQQVLISSDTLSAQADGSFVLPLAAAGLERYRAEDERGEVVLPVLEEQIAIRREARTTGVVRIQKLVREHTEQIDEPLLRESVEVERVAVDRVLDADSAAPQPRQEGETLIVPVLEEVLVVEKRLRIKEELHITRHRSQEPASQQVTLRSEEIEVQRLDPDHARIVGGNDSVGKDLA